MTNNNLDSLDFLLLSNISNTLTKFIFAVCLIPHPRILVPTASLLHIDSWWLLFLFVCQSAGMLISSETKRVHSSYQHSDAHLAF